MNVLTIKTADQEFVIPVRNIAYVTHHSGRGTVWIATTCSDEGGISVNDHNRSIYQKVKDLLRQEGER